MIELKQVEKTYHSKAGVVHALTNINFKVAPGEIFGVIGKSGAGKSTLIRCVNLLERPTTGQVMVAGQDITKLTDRELRSTRHQIGMIFQHFNLISVRTVYQNIALPLELIGYSKEKIEQTVMPLLELTGLLEKKNQYPAQLSGGQKQRVAIARALASSPKVLLCDEATSSLDPHTTTTILQLLKDINIKLGLTILLITHEMDVIKAICDHVLLLDKGKIIEQSDVIEFFTKPKSHLAKNLVKTSLRQELPIILQQQIKPTASDNTNALIRIIFHGHAAAEPFIAHLMLELNIKLNILQANIEFIKNNTLGIMVTEVISGLENLPQAIDYLQKNDIEIEVLGYVERDAN